MFLDFLHADFSAEDGGNSQIPTLSGIGSSHHVLCVKHLLGQFRDTQGAELLTSTRCKRRETDHEEVQTGKGDHVDGEFSEIRVELAGETETGGNARHDCRDEVVEVSIGGGVEFEGTNADIVQGLVVDTESLVRVFDELMDGESGVVGFNNGVGYLWRWDNGERGHHSIGVFFADFADEKSSHTGSGTSTERVRYLETLEAITSFGFASDDIQNLVD